MDVGSCIWAVCGPDGNVDIKERVFTGDRATIQGRLATAAMEPLRRQAAGGPRRRVSMRLFVAVPVPDVVRDRGSTRSATCATMAAGWTRPDGWHATLAFVGEVEDAEAWSAPPAGRRRRRGGCGGPDQGEADTLARRTALALALQDDPAGAIERLGAAVQHELADAGFDVARRRVRPHLTLGRARRRRPVPADVLGAVEVPPASWDARRGLEVVQSILGDGPATYATVARVPLAG